MRSVARRTDDHRPKQQRRPNGSFLLCDPEYLTYSTAERAFVSAMSLTAARKRTSRYFGFGARSEHSPAIITPLRGAESEAPPWRGPTRHQAGDSGLKSTRRIRAACGITEQPTSRHAPPLRHFLGRCCAILADFADLRLGASSSSSKAIDEAKGARRSGFAVRNSISSLIGWLQ